MYITFFIGNGFDLKLGLKTRYMDFYPYFVSEASDNNIIKKWLEDDHKDEGKYYELWSDLESSLGKHMSLLEDGQEEEFYKSKDELDNLLAEYLSHEQNRLIIENNDKEITEIFQRA